jgi:hypothetical protein
MGSFDFAQDDTVGGQAILDLPATTSPQVTYHVLMKNA